MNNRKKIDSKSTSNNKTLIFLISVLATITILYQFRPALDEFQFFFISFPAFTIIPAILAGYAAYLTIKLFRQKHSHAKAFLFFAFNYLLYVSICFLVKVSPSLNLAPDWTLLACDGWAVSSIRLRMCKPNKPLIVWPTLSQ